jgi:hypothetical protein
MLAFSLDVLCQLETHLERLTPTQYAARLSVFNGSSIGAHTRHILEFYDCLLASVSSGTVNYDARKRDRQVESDMHYALDLLRTISRSIERINRNNNTLILACDQPDHDVYYISTTLDRELLYLLEHTVHHLALIRIGIQVHFSHVEIHPDFGFAYSTVAYRDAKKTAQILIEE